MPLLQCEPRRVGTNRQDVGAYVGRRALAFKTGSGIGANPSRPPAATSKAKTSKIESKEVNCYEIVATSSRSQLDDSSATRNCFSFFHGCRALGPLVGIRLDDRCPRWR